MHRQEIENVPMAIYCEISNHFWGIRAPLAKRATWDVVPEQKSGYPPRWERHCVQTNRHLGQNQS
jgi:hypothetical protein